MPGARAWAMALAAFLALTWQSLVVQTHVHMPDGLAWAASETQVHADTRLSRDERPADQPLDCPICRQIGQAGAYLTPTPLTIEGPAATAAWLPAALPLSWTGRSSSHAWRSRAPPGRLRNPR